MKKLKKYKPTKFKVSDSKYDEAAADYAVNFIECLRITRSNTTLKTLIMLCFPLQKMEPYPMALLLRCPVPYLSHWMQMVSLKTSMPMA